MDRRRDFWADMTVNGVVASLLDLTLTQIAQAECDDPIEYLRFQLFNAKYPIDSSQEDIGLERDAKIDHAEQRLEFGMRIYQDLANEIALLRSGRESKLVLSYDDPGQDGYQGAVLTVASVEQWAKERGYLNGATNNASQPPRYTTPLMDLVNELANEFWVETDSLNEPKAEVIKDYVRRKYGEFKRLKGRHAQHKEIPGLSEKVVEAIIIIIRKRDS